MSILALNDDGLVTVRGTPMFLYVHINVHLQNNVNISVHELGSHTSANIYCW